jgi:hypothetical protein
MTTDLQRILESKAARRRKLADIPIGKKLRLLVSMRERSIAIRGTTPEPASSVLREDPVPYRSTPNPRHV